MRHGFAQIFTDNHDLSGVHSRVMDRLRTNLKHSEVTGKIIRVFYDVHNELGYGFLESTCAQAMVIALNQSGLGAIREVPVPVCFRGKKVGKCFTDIVVENAVLLELKAARSLEPAHEAQLLHYLRATDMEVGLPLSFGLHLQFRRLLFGNERKKNRENPCESVAKVFA